MAASSRRDRDKSSQQKYLIGVYADTKAQFIGAEADGEILNLEELRIEIPTVDPKIPQLEIRNEDTLEMAHRYHIDSKSSRILVLNMASKNAPGGGVRNGRTAQEECLFRRTNAFLTHDFSWYPLGDTSIIFSPEITVIKDAGYKRISPYSIGMISIPAVLSPPVIGGKYKLAKDRKLMERKIESLFQIGIQHRFDTLVLGALGCGVYKNPPEEVFRIFERMVNTYGHHFDRIGFAVLAFGATGKENYDRFKTMRYTGR